MIVLGIETSCDETGVALYDGEQQRLLAHQLYSQVELHAEYGGVVPELASRDHVRKLIPLTGELLENAGLALDDLNGIAYTAGPGLAGALMVGASFAVGMAQALGIPALGVHHLEGHLLAPMLESDPPAFPFLALLVSGGHSQLIRVDGVGRYELLGESLDDAAGEAFDKVAKMLGLGYPGGPRVANLAERGDASVLPFPRPMTDRPGLDMSFSGLKTATMNLLSVPEASSPRYQADVAAGFQQAVVDTLVIKCKRALKVTGLKQLVIAGGVSANRVLRERMTEVLAPMRTRVFYARPEFCTDNGAMIAYAGWCRLAKGEMTGNLILARPRWALSSLEVPGANGI